MPPTAVVRPVRIRVESPELATTKLRGVGFVAVAGGERVGPVRKSRGAARNDARAYNRWRQGAQG